MDLQKILYKIITNTNQVFQAEACSISLLDPSRQKIVIHAAVGAGAEEVRGVIMPVDTGIVGWVISNGEPALVPDVSHDERFYADIDEQIDFQTKSVMCAPLQVDGNVIGVIELMNIHLQYLDEDGLKILSVFADHAALAIENSNLLAETQEWTKQQASLFSARVEVTADRSLDEVLAVVSQQMIDALKADLCLISRFDGQNNSSLQILHGYVKESYPNQQQIVRSLTHTPSAWALDKEHPVLLQRATPDLPPSQQEWLAYLGVQLLLIIPLSYHRETIGLLEVGRIETATPPTQNELRISQIMSAQASVTIRQAQLSTELNRRLAEAQVLQEIMMVAASTLAFDDVLKDTMKAIYNTLGYRRLGIFLPDDDHTTVTIHPASIGIESLQSPQKIELQDNALGRVIETGASLVIANVHQEEYQDKLAPDTQSAMYTPVLLDGTVVAVINTETRRVNAFDQADVKLFETIAAELAIALKNAKLFQAEHLLASQQQAMLDIFADLSSELEIEALFQRIIERATEVIPHADAGSLIVPKGENFVFAAAAGFQFDNLRGFHFSRRTFLEDIPLSQQVKNLAAPELSQMTKKNMPSESSENFTELAHFKRIQSTIQAGLYAGEEVLGLLSIDSFSGPYAFTREDEQTLLLFANQAAVALQNARLFEEVRTAEANYHDLFDNANDLILTLDGNFCIISANKMVTKVTGYELSEIIGIRVTRLIAPAEVSRLYNILKQRLASTESLAAFELSVLSRNQQEILLETTVRVQRQSGRPVGLHCIARDITRRRELELQLQRTEKLSAIGELVAGVAHELNNPLTSIIGYASLLQEGDLPDSYKTDLQTIFRQAQRAQLIVRDLLTFARKLDLETEPTNINEVLQYSLSQMRSQFTNHAIQVTTNLDYAVPTTMADAHQLEQVFVNLLDNAVHALSKIDAPRKLSISTKYDPEKIRIWFLDNGPGIPEKVINRIFDPFFTTKQPGEGTGLGLSICFGIISKHQGRMWAENLPQGGAAFHIELPIEKPMMTRLRQVLEPQKTKEEQTQLRILVVDDEAPLVQLLHRILSQLGHRIDIASDGRIALDKLHKRSYDLIVCDVLMPDVSGIEVYQYLLENFPKRAERMIFITGNATDSNTRAFLEMYEVPWIAKPFLPSDLQRLVVEQMTRLNESSL